jgi:L-ascorbate metabolism protein UlaG (beta-lactamase superfamily)
MRRLLLVLVLIVVVSLLVLIRSTGWLFTLGGKLDGARLDRARRSPQFHDGKFGNTPPAKMIEGSTVQMLRRQFFGDEQRSPAKPVPVDRRTAADYATPPASGLRATWIGWATVLIEIDGQRVLTDPIWSERCSPTPLLGPKRFHQPPIALADLPPIDAVVISHDHYDHLDTPTVVELARRGTQFLVPLGVGAHLERWGVPPSQIADLDWNESRQVGALTITATPARHYSGRNPLRNNGTLWASWAVKGPRHRVWFSGDTGTTEAFKTIGAQHGPFDLTIIKIGAYDHSWRDIHFEPEAAVEANRDLGGGLLFPVHWGTFNLAIHEWSEPPERALKAAQGSGVSIVIPRPGEMIEPSAPPPVEPWWRN